MRLLEDIILAPPISTAYYSVLRLEQLLERWSHGKCRPKEVAVFYREGHHIYKGTWTLSVRILPAQRELGNAYDH